MTFQTTIRGLAPGLLLVPVLLIGGPAIAMSLNDEADTYRLVRQEDVVQAYTEALTAAGVSTTGNLFAFNIKGCSPKKAPGEPLYIHAVQDRGQPRGSEYPTFVFTTGLNRTDASLMFRTFAGKQLYLSEVISCEKTQCLLSAKTGFSDVCLSDPFGNPAPDLQGLRKDFWTDLLGWLGL